MPAAPHCLFSCQAAVAQPATPTQHHRAEASELPGCPAAVLFRESVYMGETDLSQEEVHQLVLGRALTGLNAFG